MIDEFPLAAPRARWDAAGLSNKFRRIVPKMRQALTFLATFKIDHRSMQTLAVISILALLTVSGAAYTDRLLTSEQLMAAQQRN